MRTRVRCAKVGWDCDAVLRPRHDQTSITCGSLAEVNEENRCHRACGKLPDAQRALPAARTRDLAQPEHGSPTAPKLASLSAEAPEFWSRSSSLDKLDAANSGHAALSRAGSHKVTLR